MRTDSGLTPGLADTKGEGDGELAVDLEDRSGDVEQAARATRSAAKVRGQTRRGGSCPATPRTLSAAWGFVGSSWIRCETTLGKVGTWTRQMAGEGLDPTDAKMCVETHLLRTSVAEHCRPP
jgi:hypothetical protein